MEIQFGLAERDMQILQLEEVIRNRKQLIIKKRKEIDEKRKINNYLDNVKKDYERYYEYIVNEKQQQYDALMLLKEYLHDLMKTEGVVNEQLRTAKHDQKDIMRELDTVKAELDELING